LDLTDGKRYELLDLDWLPRLERGKFDPENYKYIRSAEQVFIHHSKNSLIALSANFVLTRMQELSFPEFTCIIQAMVTSWRVLEQLMRDLGIKYHIVDFSLQYANVPSPNGRYFISNDGIIFPKQTPCCDAQDGILFRRLVLYGSGIVFRDIGYYLITLVQILCGGIIIFRARCSNCACQINSLFLPHLSARIQLDLRVEVYKNNTLVGSAESCALKISPEILI